MYKVLNKVFSMALMGLFLLLFFGAIGWATFVENDYGTPVAQKLIYKAWWFEGILWYLSLSLIFNIYRYKLLQKAKIGSLIFHVSFLVIILGAWVTRTTGFEGAMIIREGGSSNVLISTDTYLQIKVHDLEKQYVYDAPVILDGYTKNEFLHEFEFPGQNEEVSLELIDLKESIVDTLVRVGKSKGSPFLDVVTVGQGGRQENYIKGGEFIIDNGTKIAFNTDEYSDAVSIFSTDSGMYVKTPFELNWFQMRDSTTGIIARDSVQPFQSMRLYSVGASQFMYRSFYPSAAFEYVESPSASKDMKAVTMKVKQGNKEKEVVLVGRKGMRPEHVKFQLGDLHYELAYGSKLIQLPFSVYLEDFVMERYVGTESPSSFSSHVVVVDLENNVEMPYHIYMNHVLDYGGYRFFQSNYEEDEKGTILSVNHDAPGTYITYLGYLLLTIGFIVNLLQPGARYRFLLRKTAEVRRKREAMTAVALLIGFLFASPSYAQKPAENIMDKSVLADGGEMQVIDPNHAEKFGRLVVQGANGRFQPVHTMANDFLKKIHRGTNYEGQNALQVFLGFHTNPFLWNFEPIIYVSGQPVRDKLNLKGKYASFYDCLSLDFKYLLADDVSIAQRKKPAERNQYDKDILKTDERFNVLYGMTSGLYLKIIPLPNDEAGNWYSPYDQSHPFLGEDKEFIEMIVPLYAAAVRHAHENNDWSKADDVVRLIDTFQRRVVAPDDIPSKDLIDIEITYNKMDVFKNLNYIYLILGILLLIFNFIELFNPKFKVNKIIRVGFYLMLFFAIIHGIGLGMRWYISGHAPWSNGYEAVVFIGFVTVLAGLIFSKNSKIVLGATGILAWLMLFVAHMNAMDPQISNLVPVLKSYWLMIHVAIITGSYAFLGLGAILGLISLCINLGLTNQNKKRLTLVTKELTYVTELTLMIGLFMLTIGTFLGGVWANESWGRYWGWDAKETWALASILLYAIVMHFRFIPGLKGQFVFNAASLWAYSSIIMTFFGVNYYLDGLHSYAQGDPVPIPNWVPVTIGLLAVLTVVSGVRWKQMRRNKSV